MGCNVHAFHVSGNETDAWKQHLKNGPEENGIRGGKDKYKAVNDGKQSVHVN